MRSCSGVFRSGLQVLSVSSNQRQTCRFGLALAYLPCHRVACFPSCSNMHERHVLSVIVCLSILCPSRRLLSSLHVRIVELVQDVVSVLLLPLYFAVSGLKTDLTLLDNATSWGICLLTICAACLGAEQGAGRSEVKSLFLAAWLFSLDTRSRASKGRAMSQITLQNRTHALHSVHTLKEQTNEQKYQKRYIIVQYGLFSSTILNSRRGGGEGR